MTEQKAHIAGLDTLRAAAILLVLLTHLTTQLIPPFENPVVQRALEFGGAGVDLFFVLSGFLIARILLNELRATNSLNVTQFWYRRWMRTLPAYFVTLGTILLADQIFPPDRPWRNTASYFVFLQTYFTRYSEMRFNWSWSLCVEEWFYVAAPLAVVALRKFTALKPETILRAVAAMAFVESVVARSILYSMSSTIEDFTQMYAMPHCRLDSLAIGMLISTLPRPQNTKTLSILAAAAIPLLLAYAGVPRTDLHAWQHFALVGVLFGILVYASVSGVGWINRRLPGAALIAELSYALYLLHLIVSKAVVKLFPAMNLTLRLVVFFVLTFVTALLMRYLIERPFLALRDRRAGR